MLPHHDSSPWDHASATAHGTCVHMSTHRNMHALSSDLLCNRSRSRSESKWKAYTWSLQNSAGEKGTIGPWAAIGLTGREDARGLRDLVSISMSEVKSCLQIETDSAWSGSQIEFECLKISLAMRQFCRRPKFWGGSTLPPSIFDPFFIPFLPIPKHFTLCLWKHTCITNPPPFTGLIGLTTQ